jgi:hypothetical protein
MGVLPRVFIENSSHLKSLMDFVQVRCCLVFDFFVVRAGQVFCLLVCSFILLLDFYQAYSRCLLLTLLFLYRICSRV